MALVILSMATIAFFMIECLLVPASLFPTVWHLRRFGPNFSVFKTSALDTALSRPCNTVLGLWLLCTHFLLYLAVFEIYTHSLQFGISICRFAPLSPLKWTFWVIYKSHGHCSFKKIYIRDFHQQK